MSLLEQIAPSTAEASNGSKVRSEESVLEALLDEPRLLSHLHALALEHALTERCAESLRIDPLLPPLVKELIGSPNQDVSELAAASLQAQLRHRQRMEKMRLSVEELPSELIGAVSKLAGQHGLVDADHQHWFHSATVPSRLSLFKLLVQTPEYPLKRRWDLRKAGVPLLFSALAVQSDSSFEEIAILMTNSQTAQLALTLFAINCSKKAAQCTLAALHGEHGMRVYQEIASREADDIADLYKTQLARTRG